MIRWAINLLLLAAAGWVIRQFLAFFQTGQHSVSPDALLAGGEFVDIDGICLHYEKSGAGPPTVLIHGLLGSAGGWDTLTPLLADIATTYALDLPGSGLSDKPDDRTYDPAEHAATLGQFVETVIGRPVGLVTSSTGVQVALAAMAGRPELFTGLAALAPVLQINTPSLATRDSGRRANLITHALRSRHLVRLALKFATGSDARITDRQLPTLMTPALTAGYRNALAKTLEAGGGPSRETLPPPQDTPVLIIVGLDDRLAPAADAGWLHLKTGGELHLLPGCGHLPESERTAEIAALFRDFLTGDASGKSG